MVHATGAEDLRALSLRLKEAGRADLRRELFRGLQRASKPLRTQAKANATAILPHRGGLAARVAGARLSTKTRAGGNPGVRIVAKENVGRGSVDVARIDAGTVRHKTFGHRPWVVQQVRPGWFSDPMQAGGDEVRAEMLRAIDNVIRRLET